MSFEKREKWFAIVAISCGVVLFLVSGFKDLAYIGIGITIVGALDFLFSNWTREGRIANEVYGDAGEELWQFRSFIMMVGGPMLILYSILFN